MKGATVGVCWAPGKANMPCFKCKKPRTLILQSAPPPLQAVLPLYLNPNLAQALRVTFPLKLWPESEMASGAMNAGVPAVLDS